MNVKVRVNSKVIHSHLQCSLKNVATLKADKTLRETKTSPIFRERLDGNVSMVNKDIVFSKIERFFVISIVQKILHY